MSRLTNSAIVSSRSRFLAISHHQSGVGALLGGGTKSSSSSTACRSALLVLALLVPGASSMGGGGFGQCPFLLASLMAAILSSSIFHGGLYSFRRVISRFASSLFALAANPVWPLYEAQSVGIPAERAG